MSFTEPLNYNSAQTEKEVNSFYFYIGLQLIWAASEKVFSLKVVSLFRKNLFLFTTLRIKAVPDNFKAF